MDYGNKAHPEHVFLATNSVMLRKSKLNHTCKTNLFITLINRNEKMASNFTQQLKHLNRNFRLLHFYQLSEIHY